MGYKNEINYILKCQTSNESSALEKMNPGESILVEKDGNRTYVLNSPIMIADHTWKIVGMCIIKQVTVDAVKTSITAKLLTRFSNVESEIVTRLIQDAEKLK